MKKVLTAVGLVMAMGAVSMPSYAGGTGMYKQNFLCKHFSYKCHAPKPAAAPTLPVAPVAKVPEIDAANAALALALMGGIVSIARERRRKRQA